jgi:hypothetical protein
MAILVLFLPHFDIAPIFAALMVAKVNHDFPLNHKNGTALTFMALPVLPRAFLQQ